MLLEVSGDVEIVTHRTRDPVQSALHVGGHRAQVAPGDIGRHGHQALLVLAVDGHGAVAGLGAHQVAQRHQLAVASAQGEIQDLVQGTALRVLELQQDTIGVALGAVLAGLGSGHRRLDDLGQLPHAQAEIGHLVAVHVDLLLGDARLATEHHVRHALHVTDAVGDAAGERAQGVELESPHLDGHAFLGCQDALQEKLPLGRAHPDLHAGNAAFQAPAQIPGDLLVGSIAPGGGAQGQPDPAHGRCPPAGAGGHDADHGRYRFGYLLIDDVFHDTGLSVD